jgi:phosphatidylinositol alpha-1,6-mannosyltransferase
MRVGLVVPFLEIPCGWRTFSVGVVRALAEHADVEPVALVSARDAKHAAQLLPDVERVVLPATQGVFSRLRGWGDAVRVLRAARQMRSLRLDLVHSLEAFPTGWVGDRLAAALGVPHLITPVGTYAVAWAGSRVRGALYRRVLRRAAHLCPISRGTAEQMRRHFGPEMAGVPLTTVLLGTDLADRVADRPHRPGDGPPVVLSVGAVKRRKGYHLSIAAFARLQRRLPEARYEIVGSINPRDGYVAELQRLVAATGARNVDFLGAIAPNELAERYARASAFMLTPQQIGYHFEGFGLVYLEAGAYRLPVVATRSGGVPDAVRHGESGLLAGEGDVDGIADALHAVLADRALAARLGAGNRRLVEELSWRRFAAQQQAIYHAVAGSSPGDGARPPVAGHRVA